MRQGKLLRYLSMAIVCACLQACGSNLVTYDSIGKLYKGQDRNQVLAATGKEPRGTFSIVGSGPQYTVDYFSLLTGVAATSSSSRYGGGGMSTTPTSLSTRILCLYKDGRLRYWGMVGDFSKSEDPEILALAPKIVQANAAAENN